MANAFKRKRGQGLTKKMLIEKIDEMALLLNYMEQALTEWEIWFRIIPIQQKGAASQEEFEHFLKDGPIFQEMTSKIMESIREHVPDMTPKTDEEVEEEKRPALLDAQGNVIEKTVNKQEPSIINDESSSNAKAEEK